MSGASTATLADTAVATDTAAATLAGARGLSPNQRAWARFKRNRLGYLALWCFALMLLLATAAELVSNDKPFVARIDGQLLFPIISNPPETAIGGDFATPTDWKDPLITQLLAKPGNWAIGAPNPHGALSIDRTPPDWREKA